MRELVNMFDNCIAYILDNCIAYILDNCIAYMVCYLKNINVKQFKPYLLYIFSIMTKYIIVHCKHDGCYDYKYFQDNDSKTRVTSITINPPKIFLFDSKEKADDFFNEYINDVDVIDARCKKGEEVEHMDYCSCGIIELDEDENPILFYNKKNQIFLLEHGCTTFLPPQELKDDIGNMNLTNRLIKKCKTLGKEQKLKYIELGKMCEECMDT